MKKITDISQLDFNKKYNYADYLMWQLNERIELIKGWVYQMSPAPKRKHQEASFNIAHHFFLHLKSKKCKIYEAPFDVRLLKNKGQNNQEIDTIVQPDISLICDMEKLDERGCLGAPDLIVEILSPSTNKRDYNEKYFLYEENEVREYWIVNPDAQSVEVFYLEEGKYRSIGIYNELDGYTEVPVTIFPDLKLQLKDIFE